ncbi:RxLR effector protein, partial [Phytophthora megakarya]
MRSVFYVALAVAVLAHTSIVAAFTNAEESQLLSKTIPDFATDTVINRESTKRFLRVTDPDDDFLTPDDEERVKYASLRWIMKKLGNVKTTPKKAQKFRSLEMIMKRLDTAKKAPKKKQRFASIEAIMKKLNKEKNAL